MTTPSESTLGVTRQEPPTQSNIFQTLSIARGAEADKGKIVRQDVVTLAELRDTLLRAQATPASCTFEELSALRIAKNTGDKTAAKKLERLKSTNWFVCATFEGETRRKEKITSCNAIVGDADQPGTTREALIASLDALGCSYVIATSMSHGCEGQARYRVIVPLAVPVDPSRYEALWTYLNERLNGVLDPGAKDASRLNYMPRTPTGATGHEVIVVGGKPWFDAESVAPSAENTGKSAAPRKRPKPRGYTIEELRAKLEKRDPSAPEVEWWKDIAVLHHETGESLEGLNLADEWSIKGKNYTNRKAIEDKWFSSSWRDTTTPITIAHWLRSTVADASEFPALQSVSGATLIGEVPRAHHLCTDQANANRIKNEFGKKLISVAGRFYAWTGTHWAHDEGEAARYAAKLSNIVKIEAKAARAVLDEALKSVGPALIAEAVKHPVKNALGKSEAGADFLVKKAIVEALENWSVQCEMKSTQDAAIGLLRKLLTVEVNQLDRDPWALNCPNGTIDLRTGKLKAHDPSDYITRCLPVKFDSAAKAPRFERFLREIMGNDEPRVRFLQRWFGYCATGDVREQKFVVHSGPGGNGKGTLLTAITDVLGEYVGTAAPGLLASTGGTERHPTEIADLFGRRMVTAHENDDVAVLREGFIKQATGGDKLKGRWMKRDFFEFSPTHKLQLLTNHRPQIKGQDFGIWRRILLVDYLMKFGSKEDVDEGRATHVKDTALPDTLRQESEGILAWIVRGAIEWYRDGLNPPDSVIAAGLAYQSEQDRVSQFVDEYCIRDAKAWSAYSGLYTAYKSWCTSSGYQYLGKGKFIQELVRVAPYLRKVELKGKDRKTTGGVYGLRLDPDVAFGGYPAAPDPPDNSDLVGVPS